MPNKKRQPEIKKENKPGTPFRYKRGKMEVESCGDNTHTTRLAYINTTLYWLLRLAITATIIYKALRGTG